MSWVSWIMLVENYIVGSLVRSPTFQKGVRWVHRTVHDYRHGRDPSAPLREGEATRKLRPLQLNLYRK
ncbi:uncharacterized protein GGS25DRAFT_510804 [Hypoxylon fragiforme]|uniref:uncharacterized protein n=1 Tax=Hypoxylon fragiforme TaxID=63214 RepID=UPI0020C6CED4|nr:uncharacterized protein GGS25DRAFT_510804 [Hypoxylon fragiforme]KAI2603291.1 hypothetical protein GGS25DRAFT_510804 [Hypoxylon fragiforme]